MSFLLSQDTPICTYPAISSMLASSGQKRSHATDPFRWGTTVAST